MLVKFIVCVVAGLGAGIGTGLAGLSAAAVISPMLITFLGFPAYQAVAISLASDVLASAASAYTYGKNRNLDIRNGLVMLAAVLVLAAVVFLVWRLCFHHRRGRYGGRRRGGGYRPYRG